MKFLRSWFERTQEARPAERHRSRKSRPSIESLESRVVLYSATGNAWMNPAVVTISFMPDGTNLGGNVSNLQSTFNSNAGLKGWQNVILQAAQVWAQQTNLNPSYGDEPKNSGLSPVFGESLDYISTPACVTREEGCVSVVTVGRQRLGVLVNPPQPSGQSQSKA